MRGDKSSNRSTSNSIVRVDTAPAFPIYPITSPDPATIYRRSIGFDLCIYNIYGRATTQVYHTRFCLVHREYIIPVQSHDLIDDNRELVVSRVCRSRLRSIIFRFYLFIVYIMLFRTNVPSTVNTSWKKTRLRR